MSVMETGTFDSSLHSSQRLTQSTTFLKPMFDPFKNEQCLFTISAAVYIR